MSTDWRLAESGKARKKTLKGLILLILYIRKRMGYRYVCIHVYMYLEKYFTGYWEEVEEEREMERDRETI